MSVSKMTCIEKAERYRPVLEFVAAILACLGAVAGLVVAIVAVNDVSDLRNQLFQAEQRANALSLTIAQLEGVVQTLDLATLSANVNDLRATADGIQADVASVGNVTERFNALEASLDPNTTFVQIIDQKEPGYSYDTGALTDVWNTRDLNKVNWGNVLLENNQFVLPAGTWSISATVPALRSSYNLARLQSISTSETLLYSISGLSAPSSGSTLFMTMKGVVVFTEPTRLEIQHLFQLYPENPGCLFCEFGLDYASSRVFDSVFTIVEAKRIALP
ncbi:Collagen triple helix repeat-containing protein (Fragment) [Durusdinium trenchii]|uniref:Collagen triple helix repeat-containing protein n=1 Tax=Durusdinium trenchii TaxID=1381693 RepID=A0ABP0L9Y6_9DINO